MCSPASDRRHPSTDCSCACLSGSSRPCAVMRGDRGVGRLCRGPWNRSQAATKERGPELCPCPQPGGRGGTPHRGALWVLLVSTSVVIRFVVMAWGHSPCLTHPEHLDRVNYGEGCLAAGAVNDMD